MHAFKDLKGRTWQLEFHVPANRRVRALTAVGHDRGINLLTVMDGLQGLTALLADIERVIDVLWAMVQPQALGLDVTEEDFGCALAGDVLGNAVSALVEELVDFFQDARQRATLHKALAKGRLVGGMVLAQGEKDLEDLDPQKEAAKLLERLRPTSSDSFTISPASSALTPEP